MTGKSPVEIEIYGHAGRPHTRVYPTYENAEGYQIRPDTSRNFDTGAMNYYWKVKKMEFDGLNCFTTCKNNCFGRGWLPKDLVC